MQYDLPLLDDLLTALYQLCRNHNSGFAITGTIVYPNIVVFSEDFSKMTMQIDPLNNGLPFFILLERLQQLYPFGPPPAAADPLGRLRRPLIL